VYPVFVSLNYYTTIYFLQQFWARTGDNAGLIVTVIGINVKCD